MSYDVGDVAKVDVTWRTAAGALTDATTTLTVTRPDLTVDTSITPDHVGSAGSGQYTANIPLTQVGEWTYKFTAAGALTAVEEGSILVVAGAHTLGAPYATTAELKSYLKITDTEDDTEITDALMAASREIESYCGRQFNDAGSASARVFYPTTTRWLDVDDFHTTTGLIVATDLGDDGTYETTWTVADYQLEPLNGIRDGQPGWAYHRIRGVESQTFPGWGYRTPVQVTARWGWAQVPAPVKQAALILGSEMFKLAGAPFGVAGFGEFGAVRVRDIPKAKSLLNPYRRYGVLVG